MTVSVVKSLTAAFALAGGHGALAARDLLQSAESVGIAACKVPPSLAQEFVMTSVQSTNERSLRPFHPSRLLTRPSHLPHLFSTQLSSMRCRRLPVGGGHRYVRFGSLLTPHTALALTWNSLLFMLMNLAQVWPVDDYSVGEDRHVPGRPGGARPPQRGPGAPRRRSSAVVEDPQRLRADCRKHLRICAQQHPVWREPCHRDEPRLRICFAALDRRGVPL